MTDFDNIGQLMCLPIESIQPSDSYCAPSDYIITAAADSLLQTGGRNWIPLIVEESGDYEYRAITNHFVYVVAAQAALEEIWCIVIKPTPQDIEQARILAGEVTPKVNLATASRDTIKSVLKYLASQPGTALKAVDITIAASKIANADRNNWTDLTPITKLKCGITKGKKLDELALAFYLSPPPPPPEPPTAVSIKKATRAEILERLEYLTTHKIESFGAIDPEKTTDLIFSADKAKWKTLNPITKLECGINAAKLKVIKTMFTL